MDQAADHHEKLSFLPGFSLFKGRFDILNATE
jgi:hypothetical protein